MDIQSEMSKFEAEISKLTPQAVVAAQKATTSTAHSKPSVTSKPKINIQLPTSYSIETSQLIQSSSAQQAAATSAQRLPTAYDASAKAAHAMAGKRDSSALGSKGDSQSKRQKFDAKKEKKFVRMAGGQKWEDETLEDWDPDDFRLFCGDLGNEVNDEMLARAFSKYPSFQKAKIVRDKRSQKTKGFGFVSFKDSQDFMKAMREMNGKYVGNRPIKLKKSTWKDRNIDVVKKKEQEKAKMGFK